MNVQTDPKQLSPLTLAYIGDGVYELFVREYIVSKGNCPVKKLHARAVEMVRCEFQAKMLTERLQPLLTETEAEICRRGRNAHVSHVPRRRSSACSATCISPARSTVCASFLIRLRRPRRPAAEPVRAAKRIV